MTDPEVDAIDDESVAVVAAEIAAAGMPRVESAEERERRLADRQLRDVLNALREFDEQQQREAARRAEQQRQERERQAEVARAMREAAAQRQRERDARLALDRLALVESQLAAARARAEQERQERARQEHWAFMDARIAEMNRLIAPPPRDHAAERIAMLEDELAAQAQANANEAERQRRQHYQQRQRAVVERRENRGW